MAESVSEKLLGLFDTLSREFHNLNSNYEKLTNNLNQLTSTGQNVFDTKQLTAEISKEIRSTREICERISNVANELLAFKNNIEDIPAHNSDAIEALRMDVMAALINVNNFMKNFDDNFFSSMKKITEINELREELKPVAKFSKLMATPVGIISFLLIFALGIAGTWGGIYEIVKLFAPKEETLSVRQLHMIANELSKINSTNGVYNISTNKP